MVGAKQAVVHIVHNGGARSEDRLNSQFDYLSRKGDVVGQRSSRYGTTITHDELRNCANNWVRQSGAYPKTTSSGEMKTDLTTHIVVSLPPGTDNTLAKEIGEEWAEEFFASGRYGGCYDYVAFFHDDRPHPHTHIVVNRRPISGDLLRISHRNEAINYDSMREKLAKIALRKGVLLDASSREERDLPPLNISNEKYRALLRRGVVIREHEEDEENSTNRFVDDPDLAPEQAGPSFGSGRNDDDSSRSSSPGPDDGQDQDNMPHIGDDQSDNDMDSQADASSSDEDGSDPGDDSAPAIDAERRRTARTQQRAQRDATRLNSENQPQLSEAAQEMEEASAHVRANRRASQHGEDLQEWPRRRRTPGGGLEIAERPEEPSAQGGAERTATSVAPSGPTRTRGERIRRKSTLMARLRDTPARREHRLKVARELVERKRLDNAKREAERVTQVEKRYGKLRETTERQKRASERQNSLDTRGRKRGREPLS